jgi:RNA polymerase sigma factor (sigma-70 family)
MTEEVADAPDDAVLAAAVRNGDVAAYGVLYARHFHAARRLTASLGINGAERDDLIAEAFTRVLRILRAGGGPDEDFRPYLLTTMRNTVISWRRRDRSLRVVPDVPEVAPDSGHEDEVCTRIHATMAARAFATLPERWRSILWQTEIEDESPARIARTLDMTPNGVAALAYRAREGLRQAYLSQHVPPTERSICRAIARHLPDWVRHGGTAHRNRRITTHLETCADCRDLEANLRQLNEELPAVLTPLILTAPAVLVDYAAALPTTPLLSAATSLVVAAVVLTVAVTAAGHRRHWGQRHQRHQWGQWGHVVTGRPRGTPACPRTGVPSGRGRGTWR